MNTIYASKINLSVITTREKLLRPKKPAQNGKHTKAYYDKEIKINTTLFYVK